MGNRTVYLCPVCLTVLDEPPQPVVTGFPAALDEALTGHREATEKLLTDHLTGHTMREVVEAFAARQREAFEAGFLLGERGLTIDYLVVDEAADVARLRVTRPPRTVIEEKHGEWRGRVAWTAATGHEPAESAPPEEIEIPLRTRVGD